MATLSTTELHPGEAPDTGKSRGRLLICLPSMPSEATHAVMQQLALTFPGENVTVASPEQATEQAAEAGMPQRIPYTEPYTGGEWVLSAANFSAAARLATQRDAAFVLLLGPDAATLQPAALLALRSALEAGADLALPRYQADTGEALVNSALLYPLTRALFGADIRFPLPLDAGLSRRMLSRLEVGIERLGPPSENTLVWPVADASVAGFSVRQTEGGLRALPRPQDADLNSLFPAVTGSLFADVEAKANFWQRARVLPVRPPFPNPGASATTEPDAIEEIRSLTDGFRLAFNNLREIWSLVLPPQSLLALKKLSGSPAESFSFPPSLWARTVYDFALAFHLRTLNRGHLLGALTPLYLAWVASFLRISHDEAQTSYMLEITAAAFEQEKSYLVSRWRWPDRFNP